MFPVVIILVPNTSQFQCTTLRINDDDKPEVEELLELEFELLDAQLASQVELPVNQISITIRDNDAVTGTTTQRINTIPCIQVFVIDFRCGCWVFRSFFGIV